MVPPVSYGPVEEYARAAGYEHEVLQRPLHQQPDMVYYNQRNLAAVAAASPSLQWPRDEGTTTPPSVASPQPSGGACLADSISNDDDTGTAHSPLHSLFSPFRRVLSESSGLNAIGKVVHDKDCQYFKFNSSGAMAVQRKRSSAIMDSHLTHCVLNGCSTTTSTAAHHRCSCGNIERDVVKLSERVFDKEEF
jgi:hypothetical protein